MWPERSFGWASEPAPEYIRPVRRIAVRCRRQDGTFAYGVLICTLSSEQVLTLLGREQTLAANPVAVLDACVTFYDLRGGGIETSLKEDKQGLGLTKRHKKRFEARQMVVLGTLAHNLVVWARRWLAVLPSNAMAVRAWCVMSFISVASSALIPACISLRFFSIETPTGLAYSSDPSGSYSLPFTWSLIWAKLR